MSKPTFNGTDDFASKVVIDGVDYGEEFFEWEVERELTGMPADFTSTSHAASGSLKPAYGNGKYGLGGKGELPPTPYTRVDNWPPRRGQSVTIDVWRRNTNDEPHRVFTGFVDRITGNTWADMEIYLIDDIDATTVTFDSSALLDKGPSTSNTTAYSGMHLAWQVNWAFEKCGYYATVPPMDGTLLRAPLMGSTHAAGRGVQYSAVSAGGMGPIITEAWGAGRTGFTAVYGFDRGDPLPHNHTVIHRVTTENETAYDIDVLNINKALLYRIWVSPAANRVMVYNSADTLKCQLVQGQVGDFVRVEVSGSTISISSWVEDGDNTYSDSGTIGSSFIVGAARLRCPHGSKPGGVVIGRTAITDLDWKPTAYIDADQYVTTTDCTTHELGVQAATVLDKIATATCSHWGFDENGIARFMSLLPKLRAGQSFDHELVDDTDIFDNLAWEADWQDTCSQVKGVLQMPKIHFRPDGFRVEVYRGAAIELKANSSDEQFIHSPDDEDWLNVAVSNAGGGARVLGYVVGSTNLNISKSDQVNGSITGAIWDDGVDDEKLINDNQLVWTLEQIDPRSWKSTHWNGNKMTLMLPTDVNGIHPSMRGKDMPKVRARGKITWIDAWISSWRNTASRAGVYEHEMGRYAGDNGTGIVQGIYEIMSQEQVRFEDIAIRPELDMHLGDRLKMHLTLLDGLDIYGVVNAVKISCLPGNFSMSVSAMCSSAYKDGVQVFMSDVHEMFLAGGSGD